jgi:hypothetical protein
MISFDLTMFVLFVWVFVMMLGFLFEGLGTRGTLGPILITIGAGGIAFIAILLIIEVICMLFGIHFMV